MDATEIINLAVPVFLLLIALEMALSAHFSWGYYNRNDTVVNMSLGLIRQFVDIFTKGAFFAAYIYIYEHWRIGEFTPTGVTGWFLALLAVDFIYYWQHRISHESNLFWAGHAVHHSSEEFNISVALRQSFVHDLMVYPLYFLLALIGLTPTAFFISVAILAIYQYWLHTRTIPRLPEWIERIFNTPSNHRVHHGSDAQYLDKNYAGIFMFIDVLFGTYAAEKSKVHYGVINPVKSWNPLWVNLTHFVALIKTSARMQTLWDKIQVWFRRPGWLPDYLEPSPEPPSPRTGHKFATACPPAIWKYLITQYIAGGFIAVPLLALHQKLATTELAIALTLLLWGLTNIGGLQQNASWAIKSELARYTITLILAALGMLLLNTHWAVYPLALIGAFSLLSIAWLLRTTPKTTVAA